jgi:NADH-quinone oxidoreductase subunit M
MGPWILNVLIFLPAGGALVALVTPKAYTEQVKNFGLLVALVELGLAIALIIGFKTNTAGFQFVTNQSWISTLGISWHIGVDGISLFLVGITALVFLVAMAGPPIIGDAKAFMLWMLLLEAACIATFLAMDLFVFFIMFEITLVPGYFLIAGWGRGLRRSYAAFKFFIYTFAGSAFLLVGILSLWFLVGRKTGQYNFDLIALTRTASQLPLTDQKLILLSFVAAFAVKIPLVPFHTWLPDAYTEAPTAGSMVLGGILFKLGAYGILRFGVFIFPHAAIDLAPLLLTMAAVGIIYGFIVAAVQRDLKRLVAYGSIADVGFIVLGVFAFTNQGISGAVFEMINHGLITGAMFLLVGMVWERRRTYKIAELGGLQKAAPLLGWAFVVVIMASIGLPGLNGFIGEFLVLIGTFITHRWWAVVATSGVVLGAVYLLWAYQRVFQGPALAANAAVRDLSWRERGAILPLIAGIVFLGVYPSPVLNRINPSVRHLIAHVQAADPAFKIPLKGAGTQVYAVPANQVVDPSAGGSGPATAAAITRGGTAATGRTAGLTAGGGQ